MGKILTDLSFEQWLTYVFEHPVEESGREWYWADDADWWSTPSADAIQFMRHAFEHAGVVLAPYSDAQLNQGLWFLADNACSNHMFALLDPDVPWPARQQCVRSIHNLFEQCFARRCTSHLSHLDEPGASPLNLVCYMWWDILPIIGQPDDPERQALDQEILGVMESTLRLDSIPCQESALHGLGHWQRQYPLQVTKIIDTFLKNQDSAPEELRTYAMNARTGCIL